MKKYVLLGLVVVFCSFTTDGFAQSRFSVSLQGGYGSGAYEAAHTGIVLGKFAFRGAVSYSFLPILDAYVAYQRTAFACGASSGGFCKEVRVDFSSSAFSAGVRLNRGPNADVWVPWLRAGVVYGLFNITRTDGGKNFDYSDLGLGFEVGAGIAYPVTPQIEIVPSVNYTRYGIVGAKGIDNTVVSISALIGARYEF